MKLYVPVNIIFLHVIFKKGQMTEGEIIHKESESSEGNSYNLIKSHNLISYISVLLCRINRLLSFNNYRPFSSNEIR